MSPSGIPTKEVEASEVLITPLNIRRITFNEVCGNKSKNTPVIPFLTLSHHCDQDFRFLD